MDQVPLHHHTHDYIQSHIRKLHIRTVQDELKLLLILPEYSSNKMSLPANRINNNNTYSFKKKILKSYIPHFSVLPKRPKSNCQS